jgi:hypothetical protein
MTTFTGVPIHNALKTGEDRFAKGWIETIIAGVPFFKMSSVLPIDGRTYNQEHEYVLPDVQFRDLNEYPADTYGDTVDSTWGTAIIHSRIKIDRAALRSGMSNPAKLIARRYREHAKAAAMRVNWESINGTGASKGFKGLKQLITDGWGHATNVTTDGNLSFDTLDEVWLDLEHGPPNLILTNKYVEVEFTKKARAHSSFPLLDVGTDALGQPVTRYRGVPIESLRTGRTATANTNADIMPATEVGDGGNDTSSLYLIRFGEDAVTTLLGNQASMDMQSLGESTEGPYLVGQLEFYPGLASFDKFSLCRYAGITLS